MIGEDVFGKLGLSPVQVLQSIAVMPLIVQEVKKVVSPEAEQSMLAHDHAMQAKLFLAEAVLELEKASDIAREYKGVLDAFMKCGEDITTLTNKHYDRIDSEVGRKIEAAIVEELKKKGIING